MGRKDQQDFERLLDEHRGIVYKLAIAYCPAGEDRDDLVQEILFQLWRSFPSYDPSRRFSTWMYRVALNTAISFARSARTRTARLLPLEESEEAARVAAVPPAAGDDAELADLRRMLQRLPELDRALVLLHLEDKSHREIGEILGITETNVGTKLGRLKQTMRRELIPTDTEA